MCWQFRVQPAGLQLPTHPSTTNTGSGGAGSRHHGSTLWVQQMQDGSPIPPTPPTPPTCQTGGVGSLRPPRRSQRTHPGIAPSSAPERKAENHDGRTLACVGKAHNRREAYAALLQGPRQPKLVCDVIRHVSQPHPCSPTIAAHLDLIPAHTWSTISSATCASGSGREAKWRSRWCTSIMKSWKWVRSSCGIRCVGEVQCGVVRYTKEQGSCSHGSGCSCSRYKQGQLLT